MRDFAPGVGLLAQSRGSCSTKNVRGRCVESRLVHSYATDLYAIPVQVPVHRFRLQQVTADG
jgi:hypothetical protein